MKLINPYKKLLTEKGRDNSCNKNKTDFVCFKAPDSLEMQWY